MSEPKEPLFGPGAFRFLLLTVPQILIAAAFLAYVIRPMLDH